MHHESLHFGKDQSVRKRISVDRIAQQALHQFDEEIALRNIVLEIDLPETQASVYPQAIHTAVTQLIENAIQAMPSGGELSVTLIDGESQWELEIADSASRSSSGATATVDDTIPTHNGQLKNLEPSVPSTYLDTAMSAAMLHGGQVQTWDCPQGGTANVLVIPRFLDRKRAA